MAADNNIITFVIFDPQWCDIRSGGLRVHVKIPNDMVEYESKPNLTN